MDKFKKWQDQDNPNQRRIWALGIGALIFPIGIPALLIYGLPQIDRALGFSSFFTGWGNILTGALAVIPGGGLAIWSIVEQIYRASGTPFPMLPTHRLLIAGPFQYCRNPMTFGTILAYAGIAIWIGSWSALAIVAVFAGILIAYLKLIEEKELQMRFGSEYLEYKKKTPFMIPIKMGK